MPGATVSLTSVCQQTAPVSTLLPVAAIVSATTSVSPLPPQLDSTEMGTKGKKNLSLPSKVGQVDIREIFFKHPSGL